MMRILIISVVFAVMMTVADALSPMVAEPLKSDVSFVLGYLTLAVMLLAKDRK